MYLSKKIVDRFNLYCFYLYNYFGISNIYKLFAQNLKLFFSNKLMHKTHFPFFRVVW